MGSDLGLVGPGSDMGLVGLSESKSGSGWDWGRQPAEIDTCRRSSGGRICGRRGVGGQSPRSALRPRGSSL